MTDCVSCQTWDGAQPFAQDVSKALGRIEAKMDQLFDLNEATTERMERNEGKIEDLQRSQSFVKGAAWFAGIVGGIVGLMIPFKNAFLSLFAGPP